MIEANSIEKRIQDLVEVIVSYARLEFDKKVELTDEMDDIDALGAGINMLGEELRASVISEKEQEQLLQEIHHRVKNNLQIISSLINLQKSDSDDERYQNFVADTQSRIRAISVLHEMLYKSVTFNSTDLRSYVKSLIDMLQLSYSKADDEIEVEIDIPSGIVLDVDKMIPLGLIFHELISNSYKYAFPDRKGRIWVIAQEVDGKIDLAIGDSGIGLDHLNGDAKKKTLGRELIMMLAEQLNADLEITDQMGLNHTLLIPS